MPRARKRNRVTFSDVQPSEVIDKDVSEAGDKGAEGAAPAPEPTAAAVPAEAPSSPRTKRRAQYM